jgi:hypothetical protein
MHFCIFNIFFASWSLPLAIGFVLIPSEPGVLYFIDGFLAIAFLLWVLGPTPWLSHLAARQVAYEYSSMYDSVRWAIDQLRVNLAIIPVVGPKIMPNPSSDDGRRRSD